MRVTLESTTKVVEVDGVPARVWEGRTDSGVEVFAYITRIAAPLDADQSEFQAELQEHRPPANPDVAALPRRLAL